MIAKRTISVLSNMVDSIKRIWFITLLIVQSIFIFFYSYSIYANVNRLIFLVSYVILLSLSLVSFIIFLVHHRNHKLHNKDFDRTKSFVKYIVNVMMLVVNVIEMVKFGINDISKILLIISAISLFFQIIIECVKLFAERYIKDLKYAFEKDFEILDPNKWKSNLLNLVNSPLEKIASIKTGKEKVLSKEDERMKKHIMKYQARAEEEKEEISKKKQEEKETKKQQEKERVSKKLSEIKDNLKTIFTRKKQDSAVNKNK